MKSSSNSDKIAGLTDWQPGEFNLPSTRQPAIDPNEVLELFKGSLPARPPAALKGASGLISGGASWSAPWEPGDFPAFQAEPASVQEPEIKILGRNPGTPAAAPTPAQRQVETAVVEAMREKVNELLDEAHNTRAEAIRMMEESQVKAQELLEKSQSEADERLRTAYEQGKAQAEAELASAIQAAKEMLNELSNWRAELLAQSEPTVIGMVKEIARTLFASGIVVDAGTLQETFSKVLMRARSLGNLRVFVHPEDAAHLDPAWRDFQVTISGQRIQIIPTESVLPGGCYIEGDQGTVDARIENRVDAMMNVFEEQAS